MELHGETGDWYAGTPYLGHNTFSREFFLFQIVESIASTSREKTVITKNTK